MSSKYSDEYLAGLAAMSEQERGPMDIGERVALGKYLKRLEKENTPTIETTPAIPPKTKAEYFKAVEERATRPSEYMRTVEGMQWVDGWPEDIVESMRKPAKWEPTAKALREFQGHVARISTGLSYRSAHRLSRTIVKGGTKSFEPAGAYQAVVARDGELFAVYAAYQGESDARESD